VPFAVIGAAALAVHGVSRSTHDLDLLTTAPECLDREFWAPLASAGIDVSVERGDADDPLGGVVRVRVAGAPPVDLVVGKSPWQSGIVARAREVPIEGVPVPVTAPADLVLLKLYAGGPQDAWDIEQLLLAADCEVLVRDVDAAVQQLPPGSRELWARIRDRAGPGTRA